MDIYINSMGRSDKQITLTYLNFKIKKQSHLVVIDEEKKLYKKNWGNQIDILSLPKKLSNNGLSEQRQYIYENELFDTSGKNICFLDDDIDFFIRKNESLKKCTTNDFVNLIKLWEKWLNEEGVPIVGVSAKGGNNFCKKEYDDCCRLMSAYAFNKEILKKENIKFNRVKLRQDFDVVLSLLEKGYKNRVSYKFAHAQHFGSGVKGGCSKYRTSKLMEEQAFLLQKLHPKTVKVVTKKTKTGWDDMQQVNGYSIRRDVRIQWKKAYKKKSKNSILDLI